MDPLLAFAVKVEILRSIIRNHAVVLVLGWPGSGKTVSTLKAVDDLGTTYYLNAAGSRLDRSEQYNNPLVILKGPGEIPREFPDKPVLIIDDLDTVSSEVMDQVMNIITSKAFPGKIVLLTRAQTNMEGMVPHLDAIVRLKKETAEVLHTRLMESIKYFGAGR